MVLLRTICDSERENSELSKLSSLVFQQADALMGMLGFTDFQRVALQPQNISTLYKPMHNMLWRVKDSSLFDTFFNEAIQECYTLIDGYV
jgi:hypothetical protein